MSDHPLQSKLFPLCSQVGLNGPSQWSLLHSAYTTCKLAYHNLTHIADCLEKFSARKSEAENPAAIELAIWYHDAIYDPRAPDNEEQSAQLASESLSNTPFAKPVSNLILATKHTSPLTSQDAQLICDIDLSILGASPSDYQKYASAIRSEYSWVSESDYRAGRSKVLKHFLDRDFIFSLKNSQEIYETQARQNISQELISLQT